MSYFSASTIFSLYFDEIREDVVPPRFTLLPPFSIFIGFKTPVLIPVSPTLTSISSAFARFFDGFMVAGFCSATTVIWISLRSSCVVMDLALVSFPGVTLASVAIPPAFLLLSITNSNDSKDSNTTTKAAKYHSVDL